MSRLDDLLAGWRSATHFNRFPEDRPQLAAVTLRRVATFAITGATSSG